MTKISRAQIKKEVTNEVARKYKNEIENLKERIGGICADRNSYIDKCSDLRGENFELRNENIELRNKLESLEEWNERLLEFMDMPEDERKAAYKEYVTSNETREILKGWTERYSEMFSKLFF